VHFGITMFVTDTTVSPVDLGRVVFRMRPEGRDAALAKLDRLTSVFGAAS
jgi:hypothetical protein